MARRDESGHDYLVRRWLFPLALGVALVGLAVFVARRGPDRHDGRVFDKVIVRNLADVHPRPMAVFADWNDDGRLQQQHRCVDIRRVLAMFPEADAWSSRGTRRALVRHVQDRC